MDVSFRNIPRYKSLVDSIILQLDLLRSCSHKATPSTLEVTVPRSWPNIRALSKTSFVQFPNPLIVFNANFNGYLLRRLSSLLSRFSHQAVGLQLLFRSSTRDVIPWTLLLNLQPFACIWHPFIHSIFINIHETSHFFSTARYIRLCPHSQPKAKEMVGATTLAKQT